MQDQTKNREEYTARIPRFKVGLTLRSSLAIFFASLFFMPISIYLQLVAGVAVGANRGLCDGHNI